MHTVPNVHYLSKNATLRKTWFFDFIEKRMNKSIGDSNVSKRKDLSKLNFWTKIGLLEKCELIKAKKSVFV